MKVVVTGASGQLGRCLRLTAPEGARVTWCDRGLLDVADADAVARTPLLRGAEVVINAAAMTAVDAAEERVAEAEALNARAPGDLALRCAREGAHLIHLSTDYVFGGAEAARARRPLRPGDPVRPETVYGRTKVEGERAIARVAREQERWGAAYTVVRTAWLFSGEVLPGHRDFVSTMLRLAREGVHPRVVDDQTGSPTFAIDLARELWNAAEGQPRGGAIHLAGAGAATWCELARAAFEEAGCDPARVRPVTSAEYPTAARRPAWSVLESDRPLPEWRSGVRRAVAATL
ncbi:dTDP-4-dehydrorhamnose reductase [Corynebacterium mastitidis]|uniref:dTDP-4-dehydrorhamnose reductase n=1 Tax=Corynebacterium mastitidis TaxID=161890 RepID=UPI0025506CBD|nr:dTDP-4-dehydrorhamnose reductase [Corynebacterium mastitidis]MDK8450779.1 dTDP-4-dehydrorhamnose reductase [Corynebacterium mastitidis]